MESRLRLYIFMLLIQVSVAVWQHVTVMKGQTVDLRCPITKSHQAIVEWKNPEGYIMFFMNETASLSKVFKSRHYSFVKLSESEFTVRVSDVTFKHGGIYTCSHYDDHATDKTVEVTVLDKPKMKKTMHEGMFEIKCTAEGTHYPPQIFWKLDNGPEIVAHSQVVREDNKYISRAMLTIKTMENGVTVKCLVRHPTLYARPLLDFVRIRQNSKKSKHTTSSPTAQTQGSAEVQRTTTGWLKHGRTTVYLATRGANGHQKSSNSFINTSSSPFSQPLSTNEPKLDSVPTGFPLSSHTTIGTRLTTSYNSRTSVRTSVLSGSTRETNDTIANESSTTGWTSAPATEEFTSNNHTEGNRTDPKMQTGSEGGFLLVFLVTCLIFCLLVVVIFVAIKLRRAHITWKRENEDSDPSEESSKSKSSQEERNLQGQRRRGLINTAFTQYINEEPPALNSQINTAAIAATDSINKEKASQPQTVGQTAAICGTKETEL